MIENRDPSVRLEHGLARFQRAARSADLRGQAGLGLSRAARVAPLLLLALSPLVALEKLRPSAGAELTLWIAGAVSALTIAVAGLSAFWRRRAPLSGAI